MFYEIEIYIEASSLSIRQVVMIATQLFTPERSGHTVENRRHMKKLGYVLAGAVLCFTWMALFMTIIKFFLNI
jgi:hypothetical protein